jgi:hypothetical protein
MRASDLTVQCPECGAPPGVQCAILGYALRPVEAGATVHFCRRVKGLFLLERPDLAARIADWTDVEAIAALCNEDILRKLNRLGGEP